MKKFNYTKKLTLSATTIAAIGLVGAGSVFAWGPERDTYTMESPAPRAVFNSITDNPTIGDEREFVRIGTLKSGDSLDDLDSLVARTEMKSSVVIEPGKQYLVSIYYHNDAGSNKNTEDTEECHHCGIATGTRVFTSFPKVLTPGAEGKVNADISWTINNDEANRQKVWDDVALTTSAKKVYLEYVTDSAAIYNDVLHGTKLPSGMFEEAGTLIGYDILDGGIPGCEQYHGRIFYVLEAKEHSATVDKTVSKDGKNFSESVEIDPEEEVTFKLTVKNTGDTDLTQVFVKDTLPTGLTFVPGSVEFWANDSTTKEAASDDIVANGLTYPSLPKGNTYYITFRAKAGKEYKCDGINMTNKATINYESDVESGDSDEDTAKVKIKKDDCEPEPEPEEDCTTNPDLPECKKLPDTGPVEIAMAVAIALGIGGGGYYFYRTKKSLKTIENNANGTTAGAAGKETTPETPAQIQMEQPEEPKANQQ